MSPPNAYADFAWLMPWSVVFHEDESSALENQLVKEVGPKHRLFGLKSKLLARRYDCDDALFLLEDGRLACVHLTWRCDMEPDAAWPTCTLFDTIDKWVNDVMLPDHADWPDDDEED
jgi:hypothetical protein